jgi:single-stranded-DNA-specific exonuclease
MDALSGLNRPYRRRADPPAEAVAAHARALGCAVLGRVYAARGARPGEARRDLSGLLPPDALDGASAAAGLLADAIARGAHVLVIGDYDADGATATAVAVRGLRALGAQVAYLVPHRQHEGYGLTPEVVARALARRPDLIVTVDHGIASHAGIAAAAAAAVPVLVTDHHLPGPELPPAACIVNPALPGARFPSPHLAGVGVMFYVLLALRAELRARGRFASAAAPNLAALLDLVALGTVADVVRLDANNRLLVGQGLARIAAGRAGAGVQALLGRAPGEQGPVTAADLAFRAAPRLNAAGRLDDMTLGIECLLCDDPGRARALAARLDALNGQRREVETRMREDALAALAASPGGRPAGPALCVHGPDWHPGVIGLIAGRLRERYAMPAAAFAPGGDGMA